MKNPDRTAHLLRELQSRLYPRRKAAADELNALNLSAADFPAVDPAKLAEFVAAIRSATAQATDPTLVKKAVSLPRVAPGFIPLLLCLVAQLAGVLPRGAISGFLFLLATLFLGYWFFRGLAAGLDAQLTEARRVLTLGVELGVLPPGNDKVPPAPA